MGPEYEILRGGHTVATTHGLDHKDADGKFVHFPHDVDVRVDDLLVIKATGDRFRVLKIKPIVQGTEVQYKYAYYELKQHMEGRPHVSTTWNVGSAGVIAGRDIHGDVTVGITGPQLLEILGKQIDADPTIPAEEKKSLLQKLKDLASEPKIVGLAATALAQAVKAYLGLPSAP